MMKSLFYNNWVHNFYHVELSLITLFLLWLLVRIDYRRRMYKESLNLLTKITHDIYGLSRENTDVLIPFMKQARLSDPHFIISSLPHFDYIFKRLFLAVDRKKRFYHLKSKLLYIYGFIRAKLLYLAKEKHNHKNRRKFIRYRKINEVYYFDNSDNHPDKGLLINIGGGGARFFTKKKLKKGKKVKLLFSKESLEGITAKVLDVVEKSDFCIVRAKFPLAY